MQFWMFDGMRVCRGGIVWSHLRPAPNHAQHQSGKKNHDFPLPAASSVEDSGSCTHAPRMGISWQSNAASCLWAATLATAQSPRVGPRLSCCWRREAASWATERWSCPNLSRKKRQSGSDDLFAPPPHAQSHQSCCDAGFIFRVPGCSFFIMA